MLRRIGLAFIAALGAMVGLSIFGSSVGMQETPATLAGMESPVAKGCRREMSKHVDDEASAVKICDCVGAEFKARGLGVTDLFGDNFDVMSQITRSCAQMYGARLPELQQ